MLTNYYENWHNAQFIVAQRRLGTNRIGVLWC